MLFFSHFKLQSRLLTQGHYSQERYKLQLFDVPLPFDEYIGVIGGNEEILERRPRPNDHCDKVQTHKFFRLVTCREEKRNDVSDCFLLKLGSQNKRPIIQLHASSHINFKPEVVRAC